MDYSLELKKGSSGYCAPGPQGFAGGNGKSYHFSSLSIHDSPIDIAERITEEKSLSNNPNCTETEKYSPGDIIIDVYGTIGIITSLKPTTVIESGKILFNGTSDSQEYICPTKNGECKLEFKIAFNSISHNGYLKHLSSDSSFDTTSPLWHHRWGHVDKSPGFIIRPSDSDSGTFDNYDGTTKEFIDDIINNNHFCKICVLFKSGISYEKVLSSTDDVTVPVFNGYFNMIGTDISGARSYDEFENELDDRDETQNSAYSSFITSDTPLCDIYFEFSYNNKTYRIPITCTTL